MILTHNATTAQVLHELNHVYRLLPEVGLGAIFNGYRRRASKVYFHISRADTKTIRKGIVLFLKKYEDLPKSDKDRVKVCGAYDVVYALNRYLFDVPKQYRPDSPLIVVGQDMSLYPWSKNKSGALFYSGEPFNWWMLWPDVRQEFEQLSRKYKRRIEIDPDS